MKINKEGYRVLAVTFALCAAVWMTACFLLHAGFWLWVMGAVLVLFWCFVAAFFRQPRRVQIHDAALVFAPCDGRVVVTEVVHETEYLQQKMKQISIFMSITNVHMNWTPVGGTVEYFKYHPGKFLVAWHPKSSTENERTTTVIRTVSDRPVLFRQVAGLVARRIVSYMVQGAGIDQNSVAGFIKFGSRVDVLVPLDAEVLVQIGDRVQGSQTPIARL